MISQRCWRQFGWRMQLKLRTIVWGLNSPKQKYRDEHDLDPLPRVQGRFWLFCLLGWWAGTEIMALTRVPGDLAVLFPFYLNFLLCETGYQFFIHSTNPLRIWNLYLKGKLKNIPYLLPCVQPWQRHQSHEFLIFLSKDSAIKTIDTIINDYHNIAKVFHLNPTFQQNLEYHSYNIPTQR